MTGFRTLTGNIYASAQITIEDLEHAHAMGFTTIVNNRPDGESYNQPSSAQMRRAAEKLGLTYHFLPVAMVGADQDHIKRMVTLLEQAKGKTLLFCRSGTRSALLWALAEVKRGAHPEDVAAKVARAGFNPGLVRSSLQKMAVARA